MLRNVRLRSRLQGSVRTQCRGQNSIVLHSWRWLGCLVSTMNNVLQIFVEKKSGSNQPSERPRSPGSPSPTPRSSASGASSKGSRLRLPCGSWQSAIPADPLLKSAQRRQNLGSNRRDYNPNCSQSGPNDERSRQLFDSQIRQLDCVNYEGLRSARWRRMSPGKGN
jgi:hypothetical protein